MDSPSAVTLDQSLLEDALASLVDGLLLVDSSGRVSYWNPRAEDFLQLSPSQIVGASISELIARISAQTTAPDAVRSQLLAAFDHPSADATIEMHTTADPSRAVSARVFTLRENGIAMIMRDVTREREADAMKSQLLSTVSHELRTPLASIKGFATTLLRQDVHWSEGEQREFLHIIEDETDRLTEIIDNLLDMSQIEAGALRIEKEPTLLRTLLRDLVDEMRMRTEAHWFVVDLPTELPRALADPRRVRQVIRNLLDNAIKYSKSGQITISCQVDGDHIVVSVSDQGEGILPQYRAKIFDRFFQVDGKATRRKGGSGLGLSISRGIVQAHGGDMWVESVPGQGSTFRFTLPLAPSENG